MTERDKIAETFDIEDHALLYGLLIRAVDDFAQGNTYVIKARATVLYASERGYRMRKRALRDGQDLSLSTYRAYGEWTDKKNRMVSETLKMNPNYTSNVSFCMWNDTWQRYGLEEEGAVYCTYVDQVMVRTFHPDNNLILHGVLSHGCPGCVFEWVGVGFEDEEEMAKEGEFAASLEDTIKDFLYHCGHLVSAMSRSYEVDLGKELSEAIIAKAMKEYNDIKGEEKTRAIMVESKLNYSEI